ncbi:MAG TPA: phosphatase PAP2 family protein [Kofleriaceae bacterium]
MKALARRSIDWLRARDIRIVAYLTAIGLLLLVFVVIARLVAGSQTRAFDEAILLALRRTPDTPLGGKGFANVVMQLTALGSGPVAGLIVIIATAFFVVAGHWRYALLALVMSLGTWLWMWLLKGYFERERPTIVTHIDPTGGHSFPSGHSMISAALYLTLAMLIARTLKRRRLRVFVVCGGVFLTAMIGVSRCYLGVHYPTDVIAGWTFGAMWALVCAVIVEWLGARGTPDVPPPLAE